MIFNNYHAISFIKKAASEELTPDLLLGKHTVVTHGTMDHERDGGRFQQPGELDHRQRALFGHALRHPGFCDSFFRHGMSSRV